MSMIPGVLYISVGDELSKLGTITGIEEVMVTEPEPEEKPFEFMHPIKGLSASFEIVGKNAEKAALIFSGLYDAVLSACPNRRVLHLTKNARKERTRKKNLNRKRL